MAASFFGNSAVKACYNAIVFKEPLPNATKIEIAVEPCELQFLQSYSWVLVTHTNELTDQTRPLLFFLLPPALVQFSLLLLDSEICVGLHTRPVQTIMKK